MNNEFKQEFSYARISTFKNYSNIDKKTEIYECEFGGDLPFTDHSQPTKKFIVSATSTNDIRPVIRTLNLFRKNTRCFFYTTTPNDQVTHYGLKGQPKVDIETVKLVFPKSRNKKPVQDFFETTKGEQIKRHYNNPFSSVEVYKIERWIKREGDKITIKQYNNTRTRDVNSKYFRKNSNSITITFDMVKGNFLVVIYESRKKKKSFYSNSFGSLEQALPAILKVSSFSMSKGSELYGDFIKNFDDGEFKDVITDIIRFPNMGYDSFVKEFIAHWLPKFSELKEIKLPNNGLKLLRLYYPTEKYLKKNNRKLVAAILDRIGILSKVTVKILHKHPNTDLRSLMMLCSLLGENFSKHLGNINDNFFQICLLSKHDGFNSGFRELLMYNKFDTFDLSKSEIENLVHIMNDVVIQKYIPFPGVTRMIPTDGILDQFYDHFVMRDQLREYYPDLSLNVKKWDTFTTEHSRLSGLQRNIKKGYSTHLIFEKHIINEIEKVIEVIVADEPPLMYLPDPKDQRAYEKMYENKVPSYTKYMFYPKLLKTSEDYSEEGSYMHHCVAGYIGYNNSIIISLRCGTTDRVTCEYSTKNRSSKQSRYFSNKNAPDYYQKALEALDNRIRKIPFSIEPLDKIRVPLMINGKPVAPKNEDLLFDHTHFLDPPGALAQGQIIPQGRI